MARWKAAKRLAWIAPCFRSESLPRYSTPKNSGRSTDIVTMTNAVMALPCCRLRGGLFMVTPCSARAGAGIGDAVMAKQAELHGEERPYERVFLRQRHVGEP